MKIYYNNEDILVMKIPHLLKLLLVCRNEVNSSGDKILIKYFNSLYEDH